MSHLNSRSDADHGSTPLQSTTGLSIMERSPEDDETFIDALSYFSGEFGDVGPVSEVLADKSEEDQAVMGKRKDSRLQLSRGRSLDDDSMFKSDIAKKVTLSDSEKPDNELFSSLESLESSGSKDKKPSRPPRTKRRPSKTQKFRQLTNKLKSSRHVDDNANKSPDMPTRSSSFSVSSNFPPLSNTKHRLSEPDAIHEIGTEAITLDQEKTLPVCVPSDRTLEACQPIPEDRELDESKTKRRSKFRKLGVNEGPTKKSLSLPIGFTGDRFGDFKNFLRTESADSDNREGFPELKKESENKSDSLESTGSEKSEKLDNSDKKLQDQVITPLVIQPGCESDSNGHPQASRPPCSPNTPRRYFKRPLRGPYGEMLEAEMNKPTLRSLINEELHSLLQDLNKRECKSASPRPMSPSFNPQRSNSTGPSMSVDDSEIRAPREDPHRSLALNRTTFEPGDSQPYHSEPEDTENRLEKPRVYHSRTVSSPSKLGTSTENYLYQDLVNFDPAEATLMPPTVGLAARRKSFQRHLDTRAHVATELYETEKSYVESLEILVTKYLVPLKSPENATLVESTLVDEIFYQIPSILGYHRGFLDSLKSRVIHWDENQKVGDIFLDTFNRQELVDTYTSFINRWRTAKEAIKLACNAKPAFVRFLDAMAREHKGKLALDSLLIMPVQRIPRYELLIKMMLKHTEASHPDFEPLKLAQNEIHQLALKINRMEEETLKLENQLQNLREIENVIDGLFNLVHTERSFIRYDLVTMPGSLGTRKERSLFLFSDLLIIASVKRRSGTMRKPSSTHLSSSFSPNEGNKYKLLMKIPLDDLEVMKNKDETLKRIIQEIETVQEDIITLSRVTDLICNLHTSHTQLEDCAKDLLSGLNRSLTEKQSLDSHLMCLELSMTTQEGIDNLSFTFLSSERRSDWEESFYEAKQRIAQTANKRPPPEFLYPLPIRKTRAGLQFTCATPTIGLNTHNMKDVWVCNSDGYVGQVCILSLQPEPTVMSCNGVCNARILCISSVPAAHPITEVAGLGNPQCHKKENRSGVAISVEDMDNSGANIALDSSSSEEEENEELYYRKKRGGSLPPSPDHTSTMNEEEFFQPTMWIGTEDGCIHVYNCSDNIRIKKNRLKLQHGAAVHSIIPIDNRVLVSLANGNIVMYRRDPLGGWKTTDPQIVTLGSSATPVTRIVAVAGRLWCGCQNYIKVLNATTLQEEHSFSVYQDNNKYVHCLAVAGLGVWISLHGSALLKLHHATSYEFLLEINVTPTVTKMLAGCDDIIRQHKSACLRITALMACKDLLWIGTSAGVILTLPLPHLTAVEPKVECMPNLTGISYGHTGHVRLLTTVEVCTYNEKRTGRSKYPHRYSLKGKENQSPNFTPCHKMLVISGGDGYEDFRNGSASDAAGRDDSTNHLLLWHA